MEKPIQTTIHPDDVEKLISELDKTPQPNPRAVEAHRKAREIFQPPAPNPTRKVNNMEERMMTLDEYVGRLPNIHDAAIELKNLRTQLADAQAQLAVERDISHRLAVYISVVNYGLCEGYLKDFILGNGTPFSEHMAEATQVYSAHVKATRQPTQDKWE